MPTKFLIIYTNEKALGYAGCLGKSLIMDLKIAGPNSLLGKWSLLYIILNNLSHLTFYL